MSSITVRKGDEGLNRKLRVRAARHGRSMADEVRAMLRAALAGDQSRETDLGTAIHRRFARFGDVKIEPSPRVPMRAAPRSDE
jgi:antitoxin FitA